MKSLSIAFSEKYPTKTFLINEFVEATGAEFAWDSITKVNLKKFADFESEVHAQNTAKVYCAYLRAVLNLYGENLPKGWEKSLAIRKDESQNVYLSDEEIGRIIDYTPQSATEQTVRRQFILGCLTGARHSDYSGFDETNIIGDQLVYVSQKTHVKACVPLSFRTKVLLLLSGKECLESNSEGITISEQNSEKDSLEPIYESVEKMCLEPKKDSLEPNQKSILKSEIEKSFTYPYKESVTDKSFTSALRAICEKCGINKVITLYHGGRFLRGPKHVFVGSHTARRSFASNLYLRGADAFTIMRLLGQTNIQTTIDHYIVCGMRELDEKVGKYFSQFE